MYMDDNWTGISKDEIVEILETINPLGEDVEITPEGVYYDKRNLPFYDSVELLRLKDPNWEPRNVFVYFLRDHGKYYRLNGTSPPIHELNVAAPIRITEDNCIDYLEFFCFFVRGEEGPFLIAQSMDDTYVPKQLNDETRAVLEGTIRPASLNEFDAEGCCYIDAVTYYANALFSAEFKISPSGMIEMLNDEPIAADLPVQVDAPLVVPSN